MNADAILQSGIEFIRLVQQFRGPFIDRFFLAVTHLGDMKTYIYLFPLLFWCVDYRLGARIFFLCQISGLTNYVLKDVFQQPRPFDLAPEVGITHESGYGLPSGHSQGIAAFWGGLAIDLKKAWFWAVSITIILLVGFSRIYLGVHFPTDVLAGWGLGISFMVGFALLADPIEKRLLAMSFDRQVMLAILVPLAILTIQPSGTIALLMGYMTGGGMGMALKARYIPFDARGPAWKRVLRYLGGIIVQTAIFMAMGALKPEKTSLWYMPVLFFSGLPVGLWVTAGAPWAFNKFKLSDGTKGSKV